MQRLTKWGITLITLLPLLAMGQLRSESPTGTHLRDQLGLPSYTSNGLLLGFIDMSRIEFHNSYSLSMFSSGGQTQSQGMLMSQFSYALNPKLSLGGRIGYLHSPFGQFGTGVGTNSNSAQIFNSPYQNGTVFWGGEMLYRPTENTSLYFSYNNFPQQNYYNYDPLQWGGRY